jgi:mitochondrial FAD-linked sulfhydryl oxidase
MATLYPCSHCAEEFRQGIGESPPRVESRAALSIWMCEAHNRVNRLLGKSEFACVIEQLDQRWCAAARTRASECGKRASRVVW